MKSGPYSVRFSEEEILLLKLEAGRRRQTIPRLIHDLAILSLRTPPPLAESCEAVLEVWEGLGPAPGIIEENLPKHW